MEIQGKGNIMGNRGEKGAAVPRGTAPTGEGWRWA